MLAWRSDRAASLESQTMKIRVEVEVGPKELREFLGLPDVSGLQQDAIEALSKRLASSKDSLDPLALLRGLVPSGLLSVDEWQRMILKAARSLASEGEALATGTVMAAQTRKKKTPSRKTGRT
jgi:hypothetical protein